MQTLAKKVLKDAVMEEKRKEPQSSKGRHKTQEAMMNK